MEVTAPEVLTEPFEQSRSWTVILGARVMPFDCSYLYAEQ